MKNFMLIGVPDFAPTAITDGDVTVHVPLLPGWVIRVLLHHEYCNFMSNEFLGMFCRIH